MIGRIKDNTSRGRKNRPSSSTSISRIIGFLMLSLLALAKSFPGRTPPSYHHTRIGSWTVMVPQRGGPTIVVKAAEGPNRGGGGGPATTGAETEDERRRRIMAMQSEIAEDILMASEEEREALQAKKLKLRADARKAIYQAYNKVGGEQSINQIGLPTKLTKSSRSGLIDDKTKVINRGKPYTDRKFQLLFDSLWLSALGLAVVWAGFSYEASISYALGALLGFGYITLLGRTVEAIGSGGRGAGVGQARFAMVILLVLLAGKYRDTIQVIPSIIGFSTYQIASFLQAFERDAPTPPTSSSPSSSSSSE